MKRTRKLQRLVGQMEFFSLKRSMSIPLQEKNCLVAKNVDIHRRIVCEFLEKLILRQ